MNRFLTSAIAFTFSVLLAWSADAAYQAAPVTGGGAVAGKIVFSGAIPPPTKHLITKDTHACGKGQAVRRDVDVKGGALRGVVVYLDKVKKGKPFSQEAAKPVIDQKKCAFTPHIQVVQNKSRLTILNSDSVLHNIHAYEMIGSVRRSMFNIAQPRSKPKTKKKLSVKRTGHVRLECDAHNWMLGWMFVAKNPYYAVVGDDGSFTIGDIPLGSYTLMAWHPTLGVQKKKITVKANGKASVSFRFTSK